MRTVEDLVLLVLGSLKFTKYVIVKESQDFPFVLSGSDIDIFALDFQPFLDAAIAAVSLDPENGRTVSVDYLSDDQAHIDIELAGTLELRLDVYRSVPKFPGIRLHPNFFWCALETCQIETLAVGEERVTYSRLTPKMDVVLRICEYANYYWTGPDKIHHVDAILARSDTVRSEAITLLHEMTELPDVESVMHEFEQSKGMRTMAHSASVVLKNFKGRVGQTRPGRLAKKLMRRS